MPHSNSIIPSTLSNNHPSSLQRITRSKRIASLNENNRNAPRQIRRSKIKRSTTTSQQGASHKTKTKTKTKSKPTSGIEQTAMEETAKDPSSPSTNCRIRKIMDPGKRKNPCVNDFVDIWWSFDKVYYRGRLAYQYPNMSDTFLIIYDDGETEDLILGDELWKFSPKSTSSPQQQQQPTSENENENGRHQQIQPPKKSSSNFLSAKQLREDDILASASVNGKSSTANNKKGIESSATTPEMTPRVAATSAAATTTRQMSTRATTATTEFTITTPTTTTQHHPSTRNSRQRRMPSITFHDNNDDSPSFPSPPIDAPPPTPEPTFPSEPTTDSRKLRQTSTESSQSNHFNFSLPPTVTKRPSMRSSHKKEDNQSDIERNHHNEPEQPKQQKPKTKPITKNRDNNSLVKSLFKDDEYILHIPRLNPPSSSSTKKNENNTAVNVTTASTAAGAIAPTSENSGSSFKSGLVKSKQKSNQLVPSSSSNVRSPASPRAQSNSKCSSITPLMATRHLKRKRPIPPSSVNDNSLTNSKQSVLSKSSFPPVPPSTSVDAGDAVVVGQSSYSRMEDMSKDVVLNRKGKACPKKSRKIPKKSLVYENENADDDEGELIEKRKERIKIVKETETETKTETETEKEEGKGKDREEKTQKEIEVNNDVEIDIDKEIGKTETSRRVEKKTELSKETNRRNIDTMKLIVGKVIMQRAASRVTTKADVGKRKGKGNREQKEQNVNGAESGMNEIEKDSEKENEKMKTTRSEVLKQKESKYIEKVGKKSWIDKRGRDTLNGNRDVVKMKANKDSIPLILKVKRNACPVGRDDVPDPTIENSKVIHNPVEEDTTVGVLRTKSSTNTPNADSNLEKTFSSRRLCREHEEHEENVNNQSTTLLGQSQGNDEPKYRAKKRRVRLTAAQITSIDDDDVDNMVGGNTSHIHNEGNNVTTNLFATTTVPLALPMSSFGEVNGEMDGNALAMIKDCAKSTDGINGTPMTEKVIAKMPARRNKHHHSAKKIQRRKARSTEPVSNESMAGKVKHGGEQDHEIEDRDEIVAHGVNGNQGIEQTEDEEEMEVEVNEDEAVSIHVAARRTEQMITMEMLDTVVSGQLDPMRKRLFELESKVSKLGNDMKNEVVKLHTDVKNEVVKLRTDMNNVLDKVNTDVNKISVAVQKTSTEHKVTTTNLTDLKYGVKGTGKLIVEEVGKVSPQVQAVRNEFDESNRIVLDSVSALEAAVQPSIQRWIHQAVDKAMTARKVATLQTDNNGNGIVDTNENVIHQTNGTALLVVPDSDDVKHNRDIIDMLPCSKDEDPNRPKGGHHETGTLFELFRPNSTFSARVCNLIARQVIVCLLETPHEYTGMNAPANWAKQTSCCLYNLVHKRLSRYHSYTQALNSLSTCLTFDSIELAWFTRPWAQATLMKARRNFVAWDPPPSDHEWFHEMVLLREVAESYHHAANRYYVSNGLTELQVGLGLAKLSIDLYHYDGISGVPKAE